MAEEIRLKSPSIQSAQRLIVKVEQSINDGLFPIRSQAQPGDLTEEDMIEVQQALEWIRDSLNNRKNYHKKKQLQTKAEMEAFREALRGKGVDLDELRRRAAANVADRITDETVDSPERPE